MEHLHGVKRSGDHDEGDPARREQASPTRIDSRATRGTAVARSHAGSARVELFARASQRTRVHLAEPGALVVGHESGYEQGVAVRTSHVDGRAGFAACTGTDEVSVRWSLDRALESAVSADPVGWAEGDGSPLVDRSTSTMLPSAGRMEEWLRDALRRLVAREGPVGTAWIEVARTTESIAGDGALLASRCGNRAWALVMVRGRPRFLVASRLDELDPDAWIVRPPEGTRERGRTASLLLPGAAATLVQATIRAVDGQSDATGIPAGSTWRVADDPLEPGSPSGGRFDDAGFPTRRQVLWDGSTQTGRIDGPGQLRRESYRDPPKAMATSLVVEGGAEVSTSLPATVIADLRVHPVHARAWVLELSGSDPSGERFDGRFVHVDPHDLPRRCRRVGDTPLRERRAYPSARFRGPRRLIR
jgi:hypothetical protein